MIEKKPAVSKEALDKIIVSLNDILSHKCMGEVNLMKSDTSYVDLCFHMGRATCCVDIAESLHILDKSVINDLRSDLDSVFAYKESELETDPHAVCYIPEGE